MSDFQATAIVVGLFLLRCIVPLVIVMVVGYFMNRLADRWQAEDELGLAQMKDAAPQPVRNQHSGVSVPVITIPCWILRNCEPEARSDCPAYRQPGLPCWLVKSSINGLLPADCSDCPIYGQALVLA